MNHSYAKVVAEYSIIAEMYDYFSFFVEGYRFNPKFKYGSWDGKIRLMGLNGDIPVGLVEQAKIFASNMMYDIEIDDWLQPKEKISNKEFDEWLKSKTIYSGNTIIEPYWYQRDSVFEAINFKRRVLNLPTSAGKSLIQALCAKWYTENHSDKVLILVPTTTLVDQMIGDFVDYRLFKREECLGIRSGTERDSNAKIYVSTWQSAVKQPKEWFAKFGMLMNDECHLATAKCLTDIIKKMDQCEYKLGLTGSLRDGKANLLQYIGLFGKVFKPVSTKTLMDEGQVSNLKINAIILEYADQLRKDVSDLTYQQEIDWLLTNRKRNKFIIELALKLANKNENTFVMFKTIKHGKLLYEALKRIRGEDKVYFVAGETETEIRSSMKGIAEDGEGIIFVASFGVFSTGISIKKIHNVILAHPTKSKITNLQTIGRILRKHSTKTVAKLFDIIDNLAIKNTRKNAKNVYSKINYTLQHGSVRLELYAREEFEYTVNKIKLPE